MESAKVFVTGGAGFIARAIYRRVRAEQWPWEFTCYSRSDEKHRALHRDYPEVRVIRGDITTPDTQHLAAAIRGHDIVIHAAATKYVDRSELAALDTVRVNVLGSMNIMEAALVAGVKSIVGISTDKAAAPVNIYGASKMTMERIFQDYAKLNDSPRIVLVRYGNVIGSTGSVIPLFKDQLAQAGSIRITNPDMTRFWMSADDAIDTINHALEDVAQGSIALPADPRSMRIIHVAHAAVGMGNARSIVTVGARPGEKEHETLLHESESLRSLLHDEDPERSNWWYELFPAGHEDLNIQPFSITSDDPPGGEMSATEMSELIDDAELI